MVGPYPPVLGGTAACVQSLVAGLPVSLYVCRVANTGVGDSSRGLPDRLRRLAVFTRIGLRAALGSSDLVHCHAVSSWNLMGNAIVLILCRAARKPTVLTLHGGDVRKVLLSGGILSRAMAAAIRLAGSLSVVSPDLEPAVARLTPKLVRVIPNDFPLSEEACDAGTTLPERLEAFLAAHSPIVVSVGAMLPQYGIRDLITAHRTLAGAHPDIGTVVLAFKSGDETYAASVREDIHRHKLDAAIYLPQWVPSVRGVVRRADVFVRPTLFEGDSVAVREALAEHVAVVASDAGFRPPGVRLFRAGSSEDLARVVNETLMTDRSSNAPVSQESTAIAGYIQAYSAVQRSWAR